MAAEVDLIVCLIPIAEADDEFRLIVALETASGHDVEDSIGAVSIVGIVAASLDLKIINVLGVDYRAQIGGDVCVGHRYTVNEPVNLMATAHMQHVVSYVCGGHVVGDHSETVGAVSTWGLGYVRAADQGSRGYRIHIGHVRLADHNGSLIHGSDCQLKVENRRGVRGYGNGLLRGVEFGLSDSDLIIAHGHRGK